jgi:hypothetical protein
VLSHLGIIFLSVASMYCDSGRGCFVAIATVVTSSRRRSKCMPPLPQDSVTTDKQQIVASATEENKESTK